MNRLERFVYERVKAQPWLKDSIVMLYRAIFSIIPGKTVISKRPIKVRENYFFGFHDKCPWSGDNTKLLAHHFEIDNRPPLQRDEVMIGYFTGDDWSDFVPTITTKAWNWQTGAMLQWIGLGNTFIFNDFDGKKHVSRIFDTDNRSTDELPLPIAGISPNGFYAVSYSFNRMKSRLGPTAYGYANGEEHDVDKNVSPIETLKLVNISNGKIIPLLKLKDIVLYNPDQSMDDAYHYFTHALFSPESDKIVFFHRWINSSRQEFTRMFSCDLNGNNLFLFPTKNMVSHITWKNNDTILAFAEINGVEQYYLLNDRNDNWNYLNEHLFSENGHPQYSIDGLIITDTYPNRSGYLSLLLYDDKKKSVDVLAKLKRSGSFVGGIKCDLHPRWDRKGKYVSFDSAHTGTRSLCTIAI